MCVKARIFFAVNLARVHDRLQQLPQVDDVLVMRKLPAEIDIHVIERKPVAWITDEKEIVDPFASDAAFLVDARGVLMKEKKLLPEYLGLPLIIGCVNESLEAGKVVESFEARAALDFLRLSTRSFMQTRFQIREIDLSKGYCLFVTDKDHTRVTFGFDELDTQLRRLEQFLVYSDDSNRELATVNLGRATKRSGDFYQIGSSVINNTVDPDAEPRILRAYRCSRQKECASPQRRRRIPSRYRCTKHSSRTSKGERTNHGGSDLMVGLEIGTSKICVVVGESRPDGTTKILGVGQAPSRGVRKGEIVDFETAMKCVHEAVVDAEQKSDVMIRSVYVR